MATWELTPEKSPPTHIFYLNITFCGTVEPLLYDHPQNHIRVVV